MTKSNEEYLVDQRLRYNIKHKIAMTNKRKWILASWESVIPKETKCEVCSKPIYFNGKDKKKAIHFDHKSEAPVIKQSPSLWLYTHPCTAENLKIWKSCDFGMLCHTCNIALPTKERRKFLMGAVAYLLKASNTKQYIDILS